ncbi:MAG: hypothetical protein KF819_32730 [Labilithrix sp.]|nr:hypothetical protein [Labilithrix sp.]
MRVKRALAAALSAAVYVGCGGSSTAESCDAARNEFDAWRRNRLAEPTALQCTVDDDCVIETLDNACAGDCGTPVAKAARAAIKSDVVAYGNANCAPCTAAPLACPEYPRYAKCDNGKCANR